MWDITNYLQVETDALIEWAKCGDSLWSLVPTMLWTVGTAGLAHRMLSNIFHRFLFRRVPLWEIILQNLLFIWMVIYSLHFWALFVKILKVFVDYCYYDEQLLSVEDASRNLLQQWIIWIFGVMPLAYYIHTRPRPQRTPLMIWITTNPWQRRELGTYGYYLSRPLSALHSSANISMRQQTMCARRAFSDSKIPRAPGKKKRHSKSV
ncbi:hypothetical protein NE865_08326 [Phthorimaea operculella]|nr:hypothetical protein NE865_08326 [Phthorimaea operculella]